MKVFNVKFLLICFILAMIFVVYINTVYALSVPSNSPLSGGRENTQVTTVAKNIWATIARLIQMLTVACVVFAGLRYMFASADAKADIKKQTIILVVGASLVFGAASIVRIIGNVVVEAIGS